MKSWSRSAVQGDPAEAICRSRLHHRPRLFNQYPWPGSRGLASRSRWKPCNSLQTVKLFLRNDLHTDVHQIPPSLGTSPPSLSISFPGTPQRHRHFSSRARSFTARGPFLVCYAAHGPPHALTRRCRQRATRSRQQLTYPRQGHQGGLTMETPSTTRPPYDQRTRRNEGTSSRTVSDTEFRDLSYAPFESQTRCRGLADSS